MYYVHESIQYAYGIQQVTTE